MPEMFNKSRFNQLNGHCMNYVAIIKSEAFKVTLITVEWS